MFDRKKLKPASISYLINCDFKAESSYFEIPVNNFFACYKVEKSSFDGLRWHQ